MRHPDKDGGELDSINEKMDKADLLMNELNILKAQIVKEETDLRLLCKAPRGSSLNGNGKWSMLKGQNQQGQPVWEEIQIEPVGQPASKSLQSV